MSHMLSKILFFIVLTPYLTYKLDTNTVEYGIYSELYSYSTILLTILIFRLDTALFRYGTGGNIGKALGTGLVPILGIVSVALIISWLYGQEIATALGYPQSAHYVRWFAYIICLDALAALIYAKLRLESRPYRFMLYKVGNVILTVSIIVLCFDILPSLNPTWLADMRIKLGMMRMVDYVFFANLVASAVTLLAMLGQFLSAKLTFDGQLLKKMLTYAGPLVLVGIAGSINQTFSTPIQKYFLGGAVMSNLADAGIYAAAAKLAIILNLFTTAFNYAAEPFFFNNANRKDATEVYGTVALMYTLVACLVTLGIVAYLDVVVLIIGEQYRAGANIVPYLLFAYILLGLYYNVSIWYKLKDKTHLGAIISIIGMIVTITISIMLLPMIGTVASAYAALACYAVMVTICYILGRKYYPIDYPVGRILGYLAATAILCIFANITKEQLPPLAYYPAITAVIAAAAITIWRLDVRKAIS